MDSLSEIINLNEPVETKTYKKGTILQREGEKSNRLFFVKKGLLRSYTIDDKGKEHVFNFAPEGWIVSDFESYAFDYPTKLYIDCLEDVEVIIISDSSINNSNLSKEQYQNNITMLMRRAGILQARVIMLMSVSATERYQSFLETYPDLSNRVSQKLIASYLGITPEALSKLRGDLARAK